MRLRSIALLILAPIAASSLQAAAPDCDRSCLGSMLDTYMNAVVAHDAGKAPLITGFRQTENAMAIAPGKGIWKSLTTVTKVLNKYLDPLQGSAVWFGVVVENNVQEVAMVRIKVEDQSISEAEWYLSRPGGGTMQGPPQPNAPGFNDPAHIQASPPPVRNVATKNRLKRNSLIGIANSYFDALTESDPDLMLAKPDCFRVENGVLTAGRPLPAGRTDGYNGKTNCQSGMGTFNMSLVADRRFIAVDEEQQVAVTSAIFMRNANATQRRCVFFELFYVDDKQISQVYSVIYYPDPGVPVPNWGHYYGNWPLPGSFGNAK